MKSPVKSPVKSPIEDGKRRAGIDAGVGAIGERELHAEGGGGGGVEMTSPAQETHSREKVSDKQDTTVTGTYSLLPREESGVEGQAENNC